MLSYTYLQSRIAQYLSPAAISTRRSDYPARSSNAIPYQRAPIHHHGLVTLQHAVHQVSQGTPEVLPTSQAMLINEEHIMLKARVEVWFQTKLHNDRVVMTVDMSVDAVEAFEDLPDQGRESFREGNA